MSVKVVSSNNSSTVSPELHLLPCEVRTRVVHTACLTLMTQCLPLPPQIMYTGSARASTYFKTTEKMPESGLRESAFRGRRLVGRFVTLPQGYTGSILQDTKDGQIGETEERRWVLKRSFDHLTYWQHDDTPHGAEPFFKAMRFASLAEALHDDQCA